MIIKTEPRQGDCRHMDIPDGTVHCVVCSPPYYGLRKYSGEQELIWGGDPSCKHEWGEPLRPANYNYEDKIIAEGWDHWKQKRVASAYSNICKKCGAWKGAYGLEPTPELYVEHTVEILREIILKINRNCLIFLKKSLLIEKMLRILKKIMKINF